MTNDKRIEDELAARRATTRTATPASDDTIAAPGTPPLAAGERRDAREAPLPDYAELVTISSEHYVLDQEIARGGMGRIRVARDRRLGRAVAVKEILVRAGGDVRRFEREARITARLQHPSIVNVHEAGLWPTGEPFYAMQLVSGRSLDEVIAAATSFEQRLALLPNVLAVADAMAYAHGERVIHRDLKPKNVLVGGFGETVVIDWGLAKDLAEPSGAAEVSGGPFRSGGDAGETADGDVLGTPSYMPPEQAAGRPVDERADVYAIGAILDHVLSGKPPYSGVSSVEILAAVKRGPPVTLAERQPGVPPDLLAIVDRAMARDPAARYPTARELAEDLRRYHTGQLVGAHRYSLSQLLRRWLRRHRAAVSVAAVAAAVVVVFGAIALRRIIRAEGRAEAQRARAEAQRGLADDSRREAENLLGFMLGDLRDKLRPLGKLDLLEDVAKQAVAYYDRRGANLSDAELDQRALALGNLGDVLSPQGHAEDALRQYRASLAIRVALAAKDPTSADRQRDLAVGREKVGTVLRARGDTAGALAEYRAALAISETLAANDPASAERQRHLAVGRARVGDALRAQGDAAGALAEYRASLVIRETLAASDPTSADRQRDLSVGHDKVGTVLRVQGDTAGALAAYRAALAIDATLAAKDPTNADRQHDLSVGHDQIGTLLRAQGDTAGALAEYRAALAIDDTLAAKDPTSADRQWVLAVSHERVGNVLRAQGDTTGALAAYRRALAIVDALAAKDPTNARLQNDLSDGHAKVGDVLLAQGDAARALTEYRTALAIAETLTAKDATNAHWQAVLATCHERVGDARLAQRDPAGALVEYRAGRTIFDALTAKDPTNADWQSSLAVSHEKVGDALLAPGDAAGALTAYRAFMAIAETLAAKDPTNTDRQAALSVGHAKVGDALAAHGDPAGALTAYQAGLAIAQRLQAEDPQNAEWSKHATELARKVVTCCGATGTRRPR